MRTSSIKKKRLSSATHGLSPIFSTLILASIVVISGTAAYYYANNAATTATNQYTAAASENQQAISERIGFENIVYSSPTLEVYVINCGKNPNLKITWLILYDAGNNLLGYYPVTELREIDTETQIGALNIGQEARFSVTLDTNLAPGSTYTIRIITEKGSRFDHQFVAP